MEQLVDPEEGSEYGEEDCVWEDENRVAEEEEFIGLPTSEGTDQEEEEIMDEEHQILCEGSRRNRTRLCVCTGLLPHSDAMTCLNTGFNAAPGVGTSCLTVHAPC